MKVVRIGSLSDKDLEAAKLGFKTFAHFGADEFMGCDVSSDIPPGDVSSEGLIVKAATSRARYAYNDCAFSVGLERRFISSEGLIKCACVVFDGFRYVTGIASDARDEQARENAVQSALKKLLQVHSV